MDLSHLPQPVRQLIWVGGLFAAIAWISPIVDNAALKNQCLRNKFDTYLRQNVKGKVTGDDKAHAYGFALRYCER